jgi:hypothetical protein
MKFQPFEIHTVEGLVTDVLNIQLAATIFAFDVQLHPDNPFSTQAGDGLIAPRVTWHFSGASPLGDTAANIGERWANDQWIALNPKHPLAICRATFRWMATFMDAIKSGQGFSFHHGAAVRITNTRKAAVMAALGHPVMGWQRNDKVTTWCFHEAAASDAALFDGDIYTHLPTASISYAKGAILGHEMMVKAVKDIQFARVNHKGRTAIIGKDISQKKLDQLEKILYRK